MISHFKEAGGWTKHRNGRCKGAAGSGTRRAFAQVGHDLEVPDRRDHDRINPRSKVAELNPLDEATSEPCEGQAMIINNFEPIKPVDSIAALAEYRELAGYYDELGALAERSGRYRASLAYAQTAAELRRLCEAYETTRHRIDGSDMGDTNADTQMAGAITGLPRQRTASVPTTGSPKPTVGTPRFAHPTKI